MDAVFCNNCGHRNPEGAKFCSSCGRCCPRPADDTTVTFLPVEGGGETAEEEVGVTLPELPQGTGMLVVKRGPNAGLEVHARTRTSPWPAGTPRATSSSTTSRCPVATPSSPGGSDGYLVRDVGSLNGTYVNRERIEEAELASGDEVQIGKFKLVYPGGSGGRVGRSRAWRSGRYLSIGDVLSLLKGEFPDITISKIRFLESQGLLDPGADTVGLPEVLRGRRRPAALDPAPAAGALPAAEGDQGPSRRQRRHVRPFRERAWCRRRRWGDGGKIVGGRPPSGHARAADQVPRPRVPSRIPSPSSWRRPRRAGPARGRRARTTTGPPANRALGSRRRPRRPGRRRPRGHRHRPPGTTWGSRRRRGRGIPAPPTHHRVRRVPPVHHRPDQRRRRPAREAGSRRQPAREAGRRTPRQRARQPAEAGPSRRPARDAGRTRRSAQEASPRAGQAGRARRQRPRRTRAVLCRSVSRG